jgi:hypothetical protein
MRMRNLGILVAVAAAAVACGEAKETAATAGTQTYSEAAGELADDALPTSRGADAAAQATDEATDAAKKEAADAAAARGRDQDRVGVGLRPRGVASGAAPLILCGAGGTTWAA